jgi:hypothetical protein
MKRRAQLLALSVLCACFAVGVTGCAVLRDSPGIGADAATTAAGLAQGASELNPLGWATIPIRLGIIAHAETLPRQEALPIIDATNAAGWGAAASNVLTIAGAVLPGAIAVGFAVAWLYWQNGAQEREFAVQCAIFRAIDSSRTCVYQGVKYADR